MNYTNKTFSVASPGTDTYRENWERTFRGSVVCERCADTHEMTLRRIDLFQSRFPAVLDHQTMDAAQENLVASGHLMHWLKLILHEQAFVAGDSTDRAY